jgi:ArsR family transcriptional regulator
LWSYYATAKYPWGPFFFQVGVEQANASQHLAVLRAKHIVTNRKVGNQVFYALRSRHLGEVLDAMRLYFQEQLSEAMDMLEEIKLEELASATSSEERP